MDKFYWNYSNLCGIKEVKISYIEWVGGTEPNLEHAILNKIEIR